MTEVGTPEFDAVERARPEGQGQAPPELRVVLVPAPVEGRRARRDGLAERAAGPIDPGQRPLDQDLEATVGPTAAVQRPPRLIRGLAAGEEIAARRRGQGHGRHGPVAGPGTGRRQLPRRGPGRRRRRGRTGERAQDARRGGRIGDYGRHHHGERRLFTTRRNGGPGGRRPQIVGLGPHCRGDRQREEESQPDGPPRRPSHVPPCGSSRHDLRIERTGCRGRIQPPRDLARALGGPNPASPGPHGVIGPATRTAAPS